MRPRSRWLLHDSQTNTPQRSDRLPLSNGSCRLLRLSCWFNADEAEALQIDEEDAAEDAAEATSSYAPAAAAQQEVLEATSSPRRGKSKGALVLPHQSNATPLL